MTDKSLVAKVRLAYFGLTVAFSCTHAEGLACTICVVQAPRLRLRCMRTCVGGSDIWSYASWSREYPSQLETEQPWQCVCPLLLPEEYCYPDLRSRKNETPQATLALQQKLLTDEVQRSLSINEDGTIIREILSFMQAHP